MNEGAFDLEDDEGEHLGKIDLAKKSIKQILGLNDELQE